MRAFKDKMFFITHGTNSTTLKVCKPFSILVPRQAMTTHSKLDYLPKARSRQWQIDITFPTTRIRSSTPCLMGTPVVPTSLVWWTRPDQNLAPLQTHFHLAIDKYVIPSVNEAGCNWSQLKTLTLEISSPQARFSSSAHPLRERDLRL